MKYDETKYIKLPKMQKMKMQLRNHTTQGQGFDKNDINRQIQKLSYKLNLLTSQRIPIQKISNHCSSLVTTSN